MRAWFFYVKCLAILTRGVPFYRLRGGIGLHDAWTSVGYGRGKGVSQFEASVSAWLDVSCCSVPNNDGACVLRVSSYITPGNGSVLTRTRVQTLWHRVGSGWSADWWPRGPGGMGMFCVRKALTITPRGVVRRNVTQGVTELLCTFLQLPRQSWQKARCDGVRSIITTAAAMVLGRRQAVETRPALEAA